MDPITIRPYQPIDLQACRALWTELTETHRQLYADPTIGGSEPGLYFDRHLATVGAERLWVAERSGQLLGLVGLMLEGQEATIEPLVVTASERGRGVGSLLARRAVAEAGRLGARFLNVRPAARNKEAIAFFFHTGFCALGRVELFMDLQANAEDATGYWEPGPELFGLSFKY